MFSKILNFLCLWPNSEGIYKLLGKKLDAVEAEMRHLKMWDIAQPSLTNITSAFGEDTMAFEQWLRYVFLPNARAIVQSRGELPNESNVSIRACREFDGDDRTEKLQELLYEFDQLILSLGKG
jgi:uncharacterized protein YqcC (DUF446 family)